MSARNYLMAHVMFRILEPVHRIALSITAASLLGGHSNTDRAYFLSCRDSYWRTKAVSTLGDLLLIRTGSARSLQLNTSS